ncbi:MAG: TetR/AcrR family transcriptional regulator [Rhizomicrobium sp.]|nr:TetR/AcrR family transcriptional regulator [Rhizomicrobium sp.]
MVNGVKAPKRAAERIRETAEELFYREGIRAVGVDEIVARAGVTKPSLYRSYASKDELVADCLRHHGGKHLEAFDAALAQGNDLRAAFRTWLTSLSERATKPDYRGCGNSNAVVEYPQIDHPARKVAAANKSRFRARLHALAKELGAPQPGLLGDMLLLLIEGSYTSGQLFGAGGPASHLVQAVDMMIDAHLAIAPPSALCAAKSKPQSKPKRRQA